MNQGQLYGLFFYNSANNDTDAIVNVVWSNSEPPARVIVPGTTAGQGLASILFVSGSDTTTVAASMPANQPAAQIQCFIGSVKMPMGPGLNNLQLPADGQPHPFTAFIRYYTVPESHWYEAQLQSNINQFISVQFTEQQAKVYVVNQVVDPGTQVQGVGNAKNMFTITSTKFQNQSFNLQGNGRQVVFINADSVQNSQQATISLQSLAALYDLLPVKREMAPSR